LLEIGFEIVEQDIAESAAEDDPEHGIEDHVVGMAPRHRGAGLRDQLQQIPIAEENARQIGERIPADRPAEHAESDLAMLTHQVMKVKILRRFG
jgi:hypothetical protein